MRHTGTTLTGAAFLAIGLAYTFEALGWWNVDGRIFFPVLLILAGIAIVVSGFGPEPSDIDRSTP